MACAFVLADVALLVNNAHNTTNNKIDALKAYLETLLKNDWLLQKNMMFVRYNEGIRFGKYLEFESYSKKNVYESASGRTPVLMADCMYKPDLGGPAVGIRFTYEYHQKFSRDANYNLTKDIDTFYAEISAVQSGDTWGVTWEKAQETSSDTSYEVWVKFVMKEPGMSMLIYLYKLLNFWEGKREGCDGGLINNRSGGDYGAKLYRLWGWPSVGQTIYDNFATQWLPSLFGRWTSNLRFPNNV